MILVFGVILGMLILFIDGRIRYEFVSLSALLILSVSGIIKTEQVFSGFSHPAVITVASVLVISRALVKSGMLERVVVLVNNKTQKTSIKILLLMLVTAFFSAFMNNVGALALILPVALRMAKEDEISSSKLLMPIAFASLMGGMLTLIGTPPNLIVSNYRAQITGEPFSFFSFFPMGILVVILGTLFVVLGGVRLIPKRKSADDEGLFDIGEYLSEVVVHENSKVVNQRILDLNETFKIDVEVLSIIRNDAHIIVPNPNMLLKVNDILIVKTDSLKLSDLLNRTKMTLKGAKLDLLESEPYLKSEEFALVEVVLMEDSLLIGRTAYEIALRTRFGVNLVAVSRRGMVSIQRLKSFRFRSGDILLLQAPISKLQDIYQRLSCLPLADRKVNIEMAQPKFKEMLPLILFGMGIILTTFGILPVQLAFSSVAILIVLTQSLTPREFYEAIEWPTILLLASLLPLGDALQNSGASDFIASILGGLSSVFSAPMMLIVLMVLTILITNLISSTATAVLMGPVALSLAIAMDVSPDAFLMGVAMAATTAFLTPIAHQSNVLVMGPGGYQFKDYWKLGLPLSILSVLINAFVILKLWPL